MDSQKEATRGQKGAQRPALDTYKVEERRRSSPALERRAANKSAGKESPKMDRGGRDEANERKGAKLLLKRALGGYAVLA